MCMGGAPGYPGMSDPKKLDAWNNERAQGRLPGYSKYSAAGGWSLAPDGTDGWDASTGTYKRPASSTTGGSAEPAANDPKVKKNTLSADKTGTVIGQTQLGS